jgi:putative oxidoreductase
MKIPALWLKFNALLATAGGWLRSPVLLIVRVIWGWQFVQTGWGKLMNLDRTAAFFGDKLHIPFPKLNALMAGSTECFGGALLLVGLASRPVSVPLIFTMGVALATTEQEALAGLVKEFDLDKFCTATPTPFLLAALLVLAFGPGAVSLDRWLGLDKPGGRSAG